MPIKYIGKPTDHKGKKLFEILCNLKNFGKGRVVVRGMFLRYPEPTYYRIIRAEPQMDPENSQGRVWVEQVFRGVKYDGEVVLNTCHKQDYQLLSKEEEAKYCSQPVRSQPKLKILPSSVPFPPLLEELIIRDMKARGLNIAEKPQLSLQYVTDNVNTWYRKAEPEEKPTVQFKKHISPSLFEDVLK